MAILKVSNLSKSIIEGGKNRLLLNAINFTIEKPELVAINGRSGSGKSTLLHCLLGLDQPDSGNIVIDGEILDLNNDDKISSLRLNKIGIVFQFFNFLPTLTIKQNILIPALLSKKSLDWQDSRLIELIQLMQIENILERYPDSVSGGELQRAAIARALINKPILLFADEPTGNLDADNADVVLKLFKKLVELDNLAIVIVTHDPAVNLIANRTLALSGTLNEQLQ